MRFNNIYDAYYQCNYYNGYDDNVKDFDTMNDNLYHSIYEKHDMMYPVLNPHLKNIDKEISTRKTDSEFSSDQMDLEETPINEMKIELDFVPQMNPEKSKKRKMIFDSNENLNKKLKLINN